jgi:hypothetical protein
MMEEYVTGCRTHVILLCSISVHDLNPSATVQEVFLRYKYNSTLRYLNLL